MANKKYISFDLENETDKKVVTALNQIQRFMGVSPKELVIQAVAKLAKGTEYKNALRELIKEAEIELNPSD